METAYLDSIHKQFQYYKSLGDKTLAQVSEEGLHWQYNADSNSIAMIVQHLSGNMISRWTDFLTTDGEKAGRNRDEEFENKIHNKTELLELWDKGWACFLDAISNLDAADLTREVFIRNMGQPVVEAINRQLAHYPYHIGQMVFIAKMIAGENWVSLSIPRGASSSFNAEKFAQPKRTAHFSDDNAGTPVDNK
jgi:hypothetical protein